MCRETGNIGEMEGRRIEQGRKHDDLFTRDIPKTITRPQRNAQERNARTTTSTAHSSCSWRGGRICCLFPCRREPQPHVSSLPESLPSAPSRASEPRITAGNRLRSRKKLIPPDRTWLKIRIVTEINIEEYRGIGDTEMYLAIVSRRCIKIFDNHGSIEKAPKSILWYRAPRTSFTFSPFPLAPWSGFTCHLKRRSVYSLTKFVECILNMKYSNGSRFMVLRLEQNHHELYT